MSRSALTTAVLVLGLPSLLAAQESDAAAGNPILQFLFGWAPLIIILGLWLYFMRRMSAKKIGLQVERSLEHMDRLERLNEEMLEVLRNIESALKNGR